MTDEPTPNDDGPEVQLVASVDADPVLQSLVAGAQNGSGDASIGITLTVPAGIVTGELIGASRWFREVGEAHPEIVEMATELEQQVHSEDVPDDHVIWSHIHLRDAMIITGGQRIATATGLYWRGRLSEITGWSFGEFRPAATEQ